MGRFLVPEPHVLSEDRARSDDRSDCREPMAVRRPPLLRHRTLPPHTRTPVPSPPPKANNVSRLCQIIAGLQNRAKQQAEEVSCHLDEGHDPGKLISTLRDQVKTVTTLQKCVTDLRENGDGLTPPVLSQLKRNFKELAGLTVQNHKTATQKGIKLTPGIHR